MNNKGITQLGDFAIWGFTKNLEGFCNHRLSERLGITPKTVIDFGTLGHFFFHTTSGEVAESEEAIALKLGFVRSPTLSSLSAQELLDQRIAQPHLIDHPALRGNALVACFSKGKACFSAYQTVMALPQLYYTCTDEGILCATDPRCLLALQEQIRLNEDIVPMHFLFRLVPGSLTYFRDIKRLFPGEMLKWCNGELKINLAKDLRLSANEPTFDRLDSTSIGTLYERMREVMSRYLDEIEESGHRSGNLLSGGVDSSFLQLLINEQYHQSELPVSFSFAVQARSFEFETEYARYASKILDTQHTFVEILPKDYPDLLNRTVETLGQPNLYNESVPCGLALAIALAAGVPDVRYFFAGQAADALHGVTEARKLALFEIARPIPGSRLILQMMSALLARWSRNKSHGLQEVAQMLAEVNNPCSFLSPTNRVAVVTELDLARRCFGDRALLKALDYRRNLEAEYLNSSSVLEKVHVIDLLTAGYEPAIVVAQLFAAHHKRLIQFYLDEDVIQITLAFKPNVRFLKGLDTKPLLKQILACKSLSALARKRKGGTVFNEDLYDWMKHGPLRDMVWAIDRPSFMSRSDFEKVLTHPGFFLWNLLTFDIFQKRVLKSN